MSDKSIIWISPGNMAPNCAGKIGDVLVSSAVANYLNSEHHQKIHFIINSIMKEYIADTYKNFYVSALKQIDNNLILEDSDLNAAQKADAVYILRPFGDKEADNWQSQLVEKGISQNIICRIGNLNAFSINGPHMVNQIFDGIGESRPSALPVPLLKGIAKTDFNRINPEFMQPDFLILPFTGDRKKCLPTNVFTGLVNALKTKGNILIAGTKFDIDAYPDLWSAHKKGIPDEKSVQFYSSTLIEIPYLASMCKKIYFVDGGMGWVAVSGLNWLASKENWDEDRYPRLTVIGGRDTHWNLVPTSTVWKPLAKFPGKVRQANKSQILRLKDLVIKDIILNN